MDDFSLKVFIHCMISNKIKVSVQIIIIDDMIIIKIYKEKKTIELQNNTYYKCMDMYIYM